MFGISASAQSPFAALAIYVYSNTVTEPLSAADVLVGTVNFPVSQTEPVTLAEASAQATTYASTATEPVTLRSEEHTSELQSH